MIQNLITLLFIIAFSFMLYCSIKDKDNPMWIVIIALVLLANILTLLF